MSARPLPLRIEPLHDETWPSYVNRVALRLGVTIPDLFDHFDLVEPPMLRRGHGLRTTRRMLPLLAAHFRLGLGEVESMFITRFRGVPGCEMLEPALARTPKSRVTASDWLRTEPTPTCPDCRAEDQEATRLSGYLRLVLICVKHHQFIVFTPTPERPSADQVAWQHRVLAASTGTGDDPWLDDQMVMLRPLLRPTTSTEPSTHEIVHAAHLTSWTSGNGPVHEAWLSTSSLERAAYEDTIHRRRDTRLARELTLLPDPSPRMIQLAYGGTPTPGRQPAQPWFRLLPLNEYEPHISDLSWPLSDEDGRRSAALVAQAWLTHSSLRDLCPTGYHVNQLNVVTGLLHRLEDEGRMEEYLTLCAQAGDRIGLHPEAPLRPSDLKTASELTMQLRAALPLPVDATALQDWIHCHWMNYRVPPTPQRAADADQLERGYGNDLRRAATTTNTNRTSRAS